RHRRGAGVALEADDLAVIPDDALAAIDHADGLVLGFQQRTLLDMQLDEGAELALPDRLAAAIADRVERLANGDAGGILARQDIVGGVFAGVSRRGHRRRREARAFLIGPVADTERHFGLDAGIVE